MSPARAQLLESLWLRYQEELERGQAPHLDSLCAGDTDLLEALRRRIQEQSKTPHPTATLEGVTPPQASQTLSFLAEDAEATLDGAGAPNPSTPERIARFRIRRCLGEGAFGRVYQAHDPDLDRLVALKVAKLDRGDSDQRIKRFLREAKVAANLRHPHIIPLFEFGQDGRQFFIASAFISGQTLKDDLDRRKRTGARPDPRRAARIVRRLAEALAYAHGQGVVHRDVKPANVMIDEHDDPLVMDFGLATRAEEAEKLTHAGQVLGTPLYMSPEQAQGFEPAPSGDQYSLGVILYEMLTGGPLFRGAIEFILTQHVHTEPTPPRQLDSSIPRDLETICLKTLAKDPTRRYQDCQALADDLRRWLDGEPIRAKKQTALGRVVRWVKREPKLAASLLGVATLLIVVAVVAVIGEEAQKRLTHKANLARAAADKSKEAADLARVTADKAKVEADRRRIEALKESASLALLQAALHADKREGDRALLWIVRALEKALDADDPNLVRTCRTMISHWATEAPELDFIFDNLGATLRSVTHLPSRNQVGWVRQSPNFGYHCQDSRSGKLLWSLRGKDVEGTPREPILSPDGTRIAALMGDVVVLLDQKGRQVGARMIHPGTAFLVGFHPGGQTLLTGCTDGKGRLWNATSGLAVGEPFPILRNPRPVFTNDGQSILTWHPKNGLVVLDAATGQPKGKPLMLPERPAVLASSPDGLLVAAGFARSVARFRLSDGAKVGVDLVDLPAPVSSLAFGPDSQVLALGFKDGSVWLTYPGVASRLLRTPMRLPESPHHLSFHADGKSLLTANARDIRQWRIEPYAVRFLVYRDTIVHTVAHDSGHALYWGNQDQVEWDDLRDGEPARLFKPSLPFSLPLAVDPRQEFLLLADQGNEVSLCDIATGRCDAPVKHSGQARLGGFDSQGTRAFSVGGSSLVIWDLAQRRPLKPPIDLGGSIRVAEISPDGRTLYLGFDGKESVPASTAGRYFRFFDLETASALCPPSPVPGGNPGGFVFDPTGQWLYLADTRGRVGKLEARTGKRVGEFVAHGSAIYCLAMSPDGKRLATGSYDSTARLWDLTTQKPIGLTMHHPSRVFSLCFHPDGTSLVTGAEDGQVRFWDAYSGRKLKLPRDHLAPVRKLRYSRGGTRLLVYTDTGSAKTLWQRMDLEALSISVPDHLLPTWVAARTGQELDVDGNFRVLDRKAWLAAKERLLRSHRISK